MTPRNWEDRINHAGCDDVMAERQRAIEEQRALIAAVREAPPERATRTPARRHSPDWNPYRFARLRRHLGLSQSEIAERIGVSRYAWRSWESGGKHPRIETMPRLIALEREAMAA